MSKPDDEVVVENVIQDLSLEESQESFEAWAGEIVKVMTEDELKDLLKRFLHKGNSSEFVRIEMENIA